MKPPDYLRYAIRIAPLGVGILLWLPDQWRNSAIVMYSSAYCIVLNWWMETKRSDNTMHMVKKLKLPNQAVKSVINNKDGSAVEFFQPDTNSETKRK